MTNIKDHLGTLSLGVLLIYILYFVLDLFFDFHAHTALFRVLIMMLACFAVFAVLDFIGLVREPNLSLSPDIKFERATKVIKTVLWVMAIAIVGHQVGLERRGRLTAKSCVDNFYFMADGVGWRCERLDTWFEAEKARKAQETPTTTGENNGNE
jgi:hypothetical protein